MKALVFAEQRDGKIKKTAFENVSLVKKLGMDFECAVIGDAVDAIELGKYGAAKVVHYKSAKLANYTPDGYAAVLADAMAKQGADVLVMGATSMGKDLGPRVAAKLNASMATDCTHIEMDGGDLKIVRPMYAGKVLATIKLTSAKKVVTVRPNVYAAEENPASAAVEEVASDVDFKTVVAEIVAGAKGKLDVTEADIVVSGGRGLKGPENWHLIEDLAAQLGAANGASRAAVDAGWRPHDEQVGQTGKTVSPSLYVAVGISGAIQHLAGMSSSKYIVAINKDPEAPIFKVADYGIVADLFEVVPRMIEELKNRN
ncbi:MAG: electron transfer flavoprotein subunit alpha/FixB family protein [Calditrichae bacterium]|nr:electron transfer flavoprotein subunit alpha/FixB family protein [Calditrichota bacterium]MCB9057605.1 electron transfer flavoprotein subunit alpha/FixB family protein [Calditrichia bacterium]